MEVAGGGATLFVTLITLPLPSGAVPRFWARGISLDRAYIGGTKTHRVIEPYGYSGAELKDRIWTENLNVWRLPAVVPPCS
jgi:hypothetical protein